MKNNTILLVLFLIPAIIMARSPDQWNKGFILLQNDEVLAGDLKYDQKHEIIQIRSAGIIKAYSSHHALYFEYHDQELNVKRKFSSNEFASELFLKRHVFYEIVLEGEFTLLRRGLNTTLPQGPGEKAPGDYKEYDYFLNHNGKVEKLTNFKKQVLPLMADQKMALEEFIGKNNFNFSSPTSQILIINYYNHIKDNNALTSLN